VTQVHTIKPQSFKRGSSPQPPKRRTKPVLPDPKVPLLFVTSFSPAGYKDYGKRFIEGFIKHWPKDALLAVFYEGERPGIDDDRIWYLDLREDKDLQDFILRYGGNPKARGIRDGVRNFRFDALRFAPKIFALTSPLLPTSSWRVWIDADVETRAKIPDAFFSKLLRTEATAVYLGRPKSVFRTSECGFVAYRATSPSGRQFLADFRLNYTTGKIFDMPEWHDSFVFDALRSAYEDVGCKFTNLAADWYSQQTGPMSFEEHGHPWPHTKLGEYLIHHKGPAGKETAISFEQPRPQYVDLKRLCADPSLKNRYQQIPRILSVLPHTAIVEVGVAKGRMALEMCRVNLERGQKVDYTGFDLFEDMTEEVSTVELNAKEVDSVHEVAERLEELSNEYPGLLTYRLVKGNTRETLPKHRFPQEGVDFVFLDGGHSIETIESDYNALKEHAKLIVLDDYYIKGQDTEKYGCNKLVESLKTRMILPVADVLTNGMEIQMVAVGPVLSKPGEPKEMRIKTKNCVPDEEIQANIKNAARYTKAGLEAHVKKLQEEHKNDPAAMLEAMKGLDPMFHATFLPGVLRPTDTPVLFVGGSPTVTDPKADAFEANWEKIKELAKSHRVVVCKTSYTQAFTHGIVPWACFLLDPRDHVADWLNPPDCRVVWLVASMCHPSTWAHIARPGFQVLGYHAGVGAGETQTVLEYFGDSPIVHGGTTSSFRGLSLLYNLGFRDFKTIGLDSSYPTKPEKPHGRSQKPVQQVVIGKGDLARTFWTDPELIAQSQDAEILTKLHPSLKIEYLGDGLLQHAQRVYQEMCRTADPLDYRPVEQRIGTWFTLFKTGAKMPEALFIRDTVAALQMREGLLAEMLGKERSFDEFISK